mgnify:CR=1 FL=1
MTRIISSITLLGMGIYGLLLAHNNKLGLYIHPRFFEESFIASIVAVLIGAVSLIYFIYKDRREFYQFKRLFNQKIMVIGVLIALSFLVNSLFLILAAFVVIVPFKYEDRFTRIIKNDIFGTLLVLLVVLAGLFLPARGLSSITASQRSIDLNAINLTQTTASAIQNFSKSTSNYTLGDWIALQNYNPDPLFYKDKDVKISGFVYRPDNLHLDKDTFLVARFIITCCAVDARPVGLRVKTNEYNPDQDEWVEVEGLFNVDENQNLIIEPKNIIKLEEPGNPYIF